MIKTLYESLCIAFSLYSRVPMPGIKWNDGNMKYVLLFFPFVGAVEGVLFYFLSGLLISRGFGTLLTGALLTAFTFLYTGGIHTDGFLDVCDALASLKSPDERRRILKDPHVGSFAVISGIVLYSLKIAAYGNISPGLLMPVSLSFFLSRALSALSILFIPEASREGMVFSLKRSAGRAAFPLLIFFTLTGFGILFFISLKKALLITGLFMVILFYHYHNCKRNFGGISGDTAGFFLELSETLTALATVLSK